MSMRIQLSSPVVLRRDCQKGQQGVCAGLGIRATRKFRVGFFGFSIFQVFYISGFENLNPIYAQNKQNPTFRVRVYPNNPNHTLCNTPPLELDVILPCMLCGQAFAAAPPTLLACGGEGAPELDRRHRR